MGARSPVIFASASQHLAEVRFSPPRKIAIGRTLPFSATKAGVPGRALLHATKFSGLHVAGAYLPFKKIQK